MKINTPVYIYEALRTPVTSVFKGLKDYDAQALGAVVVKELLKRFSVNKKSISHLIVGNAVNAGVGQNLSRQISCLSGLSNNVTGFNVSCACGSGLQTLILGAQSILLKQTNLVVALGVESASQYPFLVNREDAFDQQEHKLIDSLQVDGLFCQITGKNMGQLAETLAGKYKISRKKQDQYALESHQRYIKAREEKVFEREIVRIKNKKNFFIEDDRPRSDLTLKKLKEMSPAFDKKGTLSAGNVSIPCDGAAGIILGSEDVLMKRKLQRRARILGYATHSVTPKDTFEAAPEVIDKCLKICKLGKEDIDLWEIGASFSAQMIFTLERLKISFSRVNIFGDDIALGHPLGASGLRALVTLMTALEVKKVRRGVVSICFGGGGAMAVVIERE